jgi:hypothetical protein
MRAVTGLLISIALATTIASAQAIDLSCKGVMHTYEMKQKEGTVDPGAAVVDLEHKRIATPVGSFRIPESTIALCLNHSDGNRKSVTRGYIKPSAEVQRARELAKLALKRDAFDRWAERLGAIIS